MDVTSVVQESGVILIIPILEVIEVTQDAEIVRSSTDTSHGIHLSTLLSYLFPPGSGIDTL